MDSDDIFIGLKRRDEAALSVLFDTYYEKLYLFAEKYIYDSDKAHDIHTEYNFTKRDRTPCVDMNPKS